MTLYASMAVTVDWTLLFTSDAAAAAAVSMDPATGSIDCGKMYF